MSDPVRPNVEWPVELQEVLGSSSTLLLQHLNEALIVIDRDRNICFVNQRARRLLGYGDDEPINGRCRHTTRGTDCGTACPLTFAINSKLDLVKDFPTSYQTSDGISVPLKVTVLPLRNSIGELTGSVEILRLAEPDLGFFLAGRSQVSEQLRSELQRLADTRSNLVVVGAVPAATEVARALSSLAGLPASHFHTWPGTWELIPEWPPGVLYLTYQQVDEALAQSPPAGWSIIVQAPSTKLAEEIPLQPIEILELPTVTEMQQDLPLMIAAWVRQLRPGAEIAPDALQALSAMAEQIELEALEAVLVATVAAAGDSRIELMHIPAEQEGATWLDDLLQAPDPLFALEGRVLREILNQCEWRMQEAADRLGVSRVTLWRKLREHGIERS
jgi:transcriptional regulator with PAS, ATPase and Fis domain